jgi:hypothetical protein
VKNTDVGTFNLRHALVSNIWRASVDYFHIMILVAQNTISYRRSNGIIRLTTRICIGQSAN